MKQLLADLGSCFSSLYEFQYHVRVRLRKMARALSVDLRVRAGLRLGKWINVRNPKAIRLMEVRVLFGAAQCAPNIERCRFLKIQTTVPVVRNRSVRRGEVVACALENAKLDVPAGTVCTASDQLVLEAPWEVNRLKSTRTYGSRFPRFPRFLKGTYSTVWGNWTDNYYHWLVEYLPRLYSLKCFTSEPVELLMPLTLSDFQKEALHICLPDNVQVRYLEDDWVQTEKFIFVPTVVAGTDFPLIPHEYFSYIRERVFRRFNLADNHEYRKRIYISRGKASRRRLANEADVVRLLEARGFTRYHLEEMSFEAQVKLFHEADIVVAPHGAGLTNVIFSGRVRVLELLGLQPVPVYFFLTLSLGQTYCFLLSEEGERLERFASPRNYEKYRSAIDADFSVDLGKLTEALNSIEQMGAR